MLCRDAQPARLFVFLNGVILLRVLSPVPGEVFVGGNLTGGYASLTPGYYQVTPSGFQSESLRDFITREINTPRRFTPPGIFLGRSPLPYQFSIA